MGTFFSIVMCSLLAIWGFSIFEEKDPCVRAEKLSQPMIFAASVFKMTDNVGNWDEYQLKISEFSARLLASEKKCQFIEEAKKRWLESVKQKGKLNGWSDEEIEKYFSSTQDEEIGSNQSNPSSLKKNGH